MKTFTSFLLIICIHIISPLYSQVGINTTSPKSLLDIQTNNSSTPSNTDGILIPRINNFPSVNPGTDQNGMMVFLTTPVGVNSKGFYYWDAPNNRWVAIGAEEWAAGTNSTGDNLIYAKRAKLSGTDVVITDDGRIGFGTSDPIERFEFKGPGDNDMQITSANPNPPNYILYNTGGTLENPTALAANGEIGSFIVKTHTGNAIVETGGFRFFMDGVATPGSAPSRFVINTTPSGSVNQVERIIVRSTGNVGIGTPDPTHLLDVNGTTRLRGLLNVGGASTLGSTLNVTGATALGSTLNVTGASTLGSTLNVTGAAVLSSTLNVTGNTRISTLGTGPVYSNAGTLTNTPVGPVTVAAGKVNANGSASKVTGATTSRVSAGVYQITLSTARSSANYIIQVSVLNCSSCGASDDSFNVYYSNQTTTGFTVTIGTNDNGGTSKVLTDREFMFTVIDF